MFDIKRTGYVSPAQRAQDSFYKGAGIGALVMALLTWIF